MRFLYETEQPVDMISRLGVDHNAYGLMDVLWPLQVQEAASGDISKVLIKREYEWLFDAVGKWTVVDDLIDLDWESEPFIYSAVVAEIEGITVSVAVYMACLKVAALAIKWARERTSVELGTYELHMGGWADSSVATGRTPAGAIVYTEC